VPEAELAAEPDAESPSRKRSLPLRTTAAIAMMNLHALKVTACTYIHTALQDMYLFKVVYCQEQREENPAVQGDVWARGRRPYADGQVAAG